MGTGWLGLNKEQVREIELKAVKLMDNHIPKGRIPIIYHYILEDANYHTLNERLTRLGKFGPFTQNRYDDGTVISTPKSYGTDYAERLWKDFVKSGGQSWAIR